MDSTIQVLEGLGYDGSEEVTMNGLASTVTLGAVGAPGGVMDSILANKWKILGGVGVLLVLGFGWRRLRARRAQNAAAVAGLSRRRRKTKKRSSKRGGMKQAAQRILRTSTDPDARKWAKIALNYLAKKDHEAAGHALFAARSGTSYYGGGWERID